MRYQGILVLTALLACAAADATAAPEPMPGWGRPLMPPVEPIAGAEALVRRGMEGLVAFMSQRPRPTGMKLAAYLKDQVASRFDFAFMARTALGPMARGMSDAQRADVVQQIEEDFLAALSRHLANYSDQQLRFSWPHHGRANRTVVSVAILNPRGYPNRLDFRLYYGREGWKVYDVVANGSSAVSYYRQRFLRRWEGLYSGR
jgi:phospholipid transport system substrate-binding protein